MVAIKSLKEKLALPREIHQTELMDSQPKIEQLIEENQSVRQQLEEAQQDIVVLQQEIEKLRAQASVSIQIAQIAQLEEQHTLVHQSQASSPIDQGVPEPNWMADWRQSKTSARDSVFLYLIGETGLSRQPSIKKLAAAKLDLRLDNGSLSKPIERLSDPEGTHQIENIEEFDKAGSTAGGALPKFFRLTDQGR